MPFDAADAASLVRLASFAEVKIEDDPFIPGWDVLFTFRNASSSKAQGYIVKGRLPSAPGKIVAAVALGAIWTDFLQFYSLDFHMLKVAGGFVGANGMIDTGYSTMYRGVRELLWKAVLDAKRTVVEFSKEMPLVVCGIGPGGPLAQLAAADLLPGRKWEELTSPATSMTAYSFSCAAYGDAPYAASYRTLVPEGYSVNLRQRVGGAFSDVWPTSPEAPYALSGQQVGGEAAIPPNFDPWLARGAAFYDQTLSGSSQAAAAVAPAPPALPVSPEGDASVPDPPPLLLSEAPRGEDFDPVLAYNLSRVCLAATAHAQNENFPVDHLPPGYLFFRDLKVGGVIYASVYSDVNRRVVAAFRSTLSWQDTLDTWGSLSRVTRPAWLAPLDGSIMTGLSNIYDKIRGELRKTLVDMKLPSLPLTLTGHDAGGALASIAMMDLLKNPESGAPQASSVVTFGASPVGDVRFVNTFTDKVGDKSIQVVRPLDAIPRLRFPGIFTVPTQFRLDGTQPDDGSTFHALTLYSNLLDPRVAAAVPAERDLSDAEREHYERGKWSTYRETEVHTCTVDSAEQGGRMVISWEKQRSLLGSSTYENWTANIASRRIIVRPGHELAIEAPRGQRVHLLIGELVLGPGSRVVISTEARLHVSRLVALEPAPGAAETAPPTVVITSASGPPGSRGGPGHPGMDGGYRQSGSPGSSGQNGGGGGSALNLSPAIFDLGSIQGELRIFAKAGDGGAGGDSGRGGAGGMGGPDGAGGLAPGGPGGPGGNGGAGGDAGRGSEIVVTYTASGLVSIRVDTPLPRGGEGGRGGSGGDGGRGNPAGRPGNPGGGGGSGRDGTVAVVALIPRS